MSRPKDRPWLSPTGVELSTHELREISKSWGENEWAKYLNWYQSPCREFLVGAATYDAIGEDMTQTIFELFAHDLSDENRALCDELLESLEPFEAKVLRLIFWEGRTMREIASSFGRSVRFIYQIKNRALMRLRRGQDGEKINTRHLMRGEI